MHIGDSYIRERCCSDPSVRSCHTHAMQVKVFLPNQPGWNETLRSLRIEHGWIKFLNGELKVGGDHLKLHTVKLCNVELNPPWRSFFPEDNKDNEGSYISSQVRFRARTEGSGRTWLIPTHGNIEGVKQEGHDNSIRLNEYLVLHLGKVSWPS